MTAGNIIIELKGSANKVGQLYPVLLDANGNIIDGHHRLQADQNWFKVKLEHVRTEEEILLCKLISNMCRRNIGRAEKVELLERLGNVYLSEGVGRNRLPHKIAEKTGMSYRWVMKYLPDHMKARPGLGGPSNDCAKEHETKDSQFSDTLVAHRATNLFSLLSGIPQRKVIEIKKFGNTNFVQVLLEKEFYSNLESLSTKLGMPPILLINAMFHSMLKELGIMCRRDFTGQNHDIQSSIAR